jgi:hypothetical protein
VRLWIRVGSGWGVSLGFWGTLLYAFAYLMWLMFVAAVIVATVIVIAALVILAVAGVLVATAYSWARDPGGGFRGRARARLGALWLHIRSWSDRG